MSRTPHVQVSYRRWKLWMAVAPGLGLSLLIALASRFGHGLLPVSFAKLIAEVVLALGLGFAIGNLVTLPTYLLPGLNFCSKKILPAAIVLLGSQLSLGRAITIGGKALFLIVILITLALVYRFSKTYPYQLVVSASNFFHR